MKKTKAVLFILSFILPIVSFANWALSKYKIPDEIGRVGIKDHIWTMRDKAIIYKRQATGEHCLYRLELDKPLAKPLKKVIALPKDCCSEYLMSISKQGTGYFFVSNHLGAQLVHIDKNFNVSKVNLPEKVLGGEVTSLPHGQGFIFRNDKLNQLTIFRSGKFTTYSHPCLLNSKNSRDSY